MTVRAVFFDLDDTLADTAAHDRSAYRACADLLAARAPALDAERVISAYRRRLAAEPWHPASMAPGGGVSASTPSVAAWRGGLWAAALEEDESDEGAGGVAGGGAAAAAALGEALQRRFDEARLDEFAWAEGAEAMVRRLREAGLELCLITNGHSEVQHPKLEALRAAELFGAQRLFVGGDEIRAGRGEKPDPRIFQRACDAAGVAPGEAIHVGDSLASDVRGALDAGLLAAVWVRPGEMALPAEAPRPHFIVASVAELPSVLADLGGPQV